MRGGLDFEDEKTCIKLLEDKVGYEIRVAEHICLIGTNQMDLCNSEAGKMVHVFVVRFLIINA